MGEYDTINIFYGRIRYDKYILWEEYYKYILWENTINIFYERIL